MQRKNTHLQVDERFPLVINKLILQHFDIAEWAAFKRVSKDWSRHVSAAINDVIDHLPGRFDFNFNDYTVGNGEIHLHLPYLTTITPPLKIPDHFKDPNTIQFLVNKFIINLLKLDGPHKVSLFNYLAHLRRTEHAIPGHFMEEVIHQFNNPNRLEYVCKRDVKLAHLAMNSPLKNCLPIAEQQDPPKFRLAARATFAEKKRTQTGYEALFWWFIVATTMYNLCREDSIFTPVVIGLALATLEYITRHFVMHVIKDPVPDTVKTLADKFVQTNSLATSKFSLGKCFSALFYKNQMPDETLKLLRTPHLRPGR